MDFQKVFEARRKLFQEIEAGTVVERSSFSFSPEFDQINIIFLGSNGTEDPMKNLGLEVKFIREDNTCPMKSICSSPIEENLSIGEAFRFLRKTCNLWTAASKIGKVFFEVKDLYPSKSVYEAIDLESPNKFATSLYCWVIWTYVVRHNGYPRSWTDHCTPRDIFGDFI